MTIEEFYNAVGGSYASVKELFLTDERIRKYVLKFKTEGSYQTLMDAVASGEPKTAFEAAHAFKGVAGNIGFTRLFNAASDLTEQLRGSQEPADPQLVEKIREYYAEVQENILKL